MQIIVQVPDNLVEPVKDQLARIPTGVLEAVALDAITRYLKLLAKGADSPQGPTTNTQA